MDSAFKKNLLLSVIGHGVVIGLLAMLVGFSVPQKKPEFVQLMDLAPELGQPAPPSPPAVKNSTPTPAPAPVPPEPVKTQPPAPPEPVKPAPPEPPTEVKTTPDPIAIPVKQPPKTKPPLKPAPKPPAQKPAPTVKNPPAEHKVVVNTKTVTRTNPSATTATPPKTQSNANVGATTDSKSFSDRLNEKLSKVGGLVAAKGATGTGTSASSNEFAEYYTHIFQAMYGAWQPPLGLADGITSMIQIRVEKNGDISKVLLVNSSGNKLMDDSAVAAANRVKKLNSPPAGLLNKDVAEITINFKKQTD